MPVDPSDTDEILGIIRCARCGHRLNGEIECPFCSMFPDEEKREVLPKWIYITACFLTSPLSIYFIARSARLNTFEKVLAISGCLMWFGIYYLAG